MIAMKWNSSIMAVPTKLGWATSFSNGQNAKSISSSWQLCGMRKPSRITPSISAIAKMKGHMNMTTSRMQHRKGMQMLGNVAHWPPLVYVLLGLALGGVWALGTSVQVLTSEAWMMGRALTQIDFTAFGQLWQAVTGHLPPTMLVPFMFGWGVQFALIVASIGIELPSHPRWRYWLAWIAVIFFITFCILLFAIMAFKQAWTVMRQPAS